MMNLVVGPVVADAMTVTVQKEVAERMVAEPGRQEYGILSVFLKAAGRAKVIRKLSPKVFWPQPQVDSAMVRFDRDKAKVAQIRSIGIFSEVVPLFMEHRRKMLRACVKFADGEIAKVQWDDIFARAFVQPHQRPEELTAENYVAMANLCNETLG
jgi:16S rRNA (adenine1518-N6/adenine1519-N6)-dimethyltransferase